MGIETILAIAVFAIPVVVAALLGAITWRRLTPLAFRCLRCGHEFQQAPHRRYPVACPSCTSADWSA